MATSRRCGDQLRLTPRICLSWAVMMLAMLASNTATAMVRFGGAGEG